MSNNNKNTNTIWIGRKLQLATDYYGNKLDTSDDVVVISCVCVNECVCVFVSLLTRDELDFSAFYSACRNGHYKQLPLDLFVFISTCFILTVSFSWSDTRSYTIQFTSMSCSKCVSHYLAMFVLVKMFVPECIMHYCMHFKWSQNT